MTSDDREKQQQLFDDDTSLTSFSFRNQQSSAGNSPGKGISDYNSTISPRY